MGKVAAYRNQAGVFLNQIITYVVVRLKDRKPLRVIQTVLIFQEKKDKLTTGISE